MKSILIETTHKDRTYFPTRRSSDLAEKQKIEKTESLLAKLKTVPASEFGQNKNLYQQLSKMHPSNEKYKEKLAHYTAKVERSEEHTSELQSRGHLVCRLLLEKT